MFNRKKGPTQSFVHADYCKILKADPSTQIPWLEVERGHWVATCQCGVQHHHEPPEPRARLDPLDPSTFRHFPACEYRDATDPALIKIMLKVRDVADGDYWVVECGSCETLWQVPHYAAKRWGDDDPLPRRAPTNGGGQPAGALRRRET